MILATEQRISYVKIHNVSGRPSYFVGSVVPELLDLPSLSIPNRQKGVRVNSVVVAIARLEGNRLPVQFSFCILGPVLR
jgi:hypothetical protein